MRLTAIPLLLLPALPALAADEPESGGIPAAIAADVASGRAVFERVWLPAPGPAETDGLGPLFNAASCAECHAADAGARRVLRLSAPAPEGEPPTEAEAILAGRGDLPAIRRGDPQFGGQIQDRAVPGLAPEAVLSLHWETTPVAAPGDGSAIALRRPVPALDLGAGTLAPGAAMSLRTAPRLAGLALLEAIPDAAILAREDPLDADGDGISGRANLVWSGARLAVVPGRFGWKATEATLRDQSAAAFSADMGLSSFLRPADAGDCTALQTACLALPGGGEGPATEEVSDADLAAVALYAGWTGLSRPPEDGPGAALFAKTGCGACHLPEMQVPQPPAAGGTGTRHIHPFTDLLLHDMGPGLADSLPAGRATGAEWRTAPLTGLGRATAFLHDGRAGTIAEAILWHGGEAAAARARFAALDAADRDRLLDWLAGL